MKMWGDPTPPRRRRPSPARVGRPHTGAVLGAKHCAEERHPSLSGEGPGEGSPPRGTRRDGKRPRWAAHSPLARRQALHPGGDAVDIYAMLEGAILHREQVVATYEGA